MHPALRFEDAGIKEYRIRVLGVRVLLCEPHRVIKERVWRVCSWRSSPRVSSRRA